MTFTSAVVAMALTSPRTADSDDVTQSLGVN